MPPRISPDPDPARRLQQLETTFRSAIRNNNVSDAEVRTLWSLALTLEDKAKLKSLFDEAKASNPQLKVASRLSALLGESGPVSAAGRIDLRPVSPSGYKADMAKLNALFPGQPPMRTIEDAFTAIVDLGERKLPAPTHLFPGKPVNVVPYSNENGGVDAAGKAVPRGDAEIAKLFQPGEIGFAIKHHRPEHRTLSGAGANDKEALKLQDTHIEIVVGTEEKARDGSTVRGAVTVNNPQSYENGQFGTPSYPMIFVRPKFPDYLSADQVKAFHDNIRTMLVGFNTVTVFPGDYNGGDPLGARSPGEVKTLVENMIRAATGDAQAKAFFDKPENKVYCAELAHLSTTAGVLFPLNKATWAPIVGGEVWSKFEAQIAKHNSGDAGAFTRANSNPNVGKISLKLAPDSLRPMTEYAPPMAREGLKDKLAFQPMTMSDIVEEFMRTHIPREQLGEALAPAQAALLEKMKPGLLEAMGMDSLPASDPRRAAVEGLFGQMVQTVGRQHGSYSEFRAAIAPLLEQARQVTGPRGDGKGLFTPPSLFHVIAQGKHPGGLIGLEYLGHGLHYSVVNQ
ncbi:MAG: hypothetical protein HYZ28_00075 [Myxococcales bacterium]|nr:hypothetical protein [Myxococcales bacterium]